MVSLRTWRACLTADVNCIASASDRAWQQKSVCVRDASSLASSAVPTSPSLQTKQISPLDAALQTSKSLKLYRSHAISPPVWGRISKKVEGSCYSVGSYSSFLPPPPPLLSKIARVRHCLPSSMCGVAPLIPQTLTCSITDGGLSLCTWSIKTMI